MKKQIKNAPIISSGISLKISGIDYKGLGGKKHPLLMALYNFLINLLLVMGSVFTLTSMLKIECNNVILAILLGVFTFIFTAIQYLPKKPKIITILSFLGVTFIVIGVFLNQFLEGAENAFTFGKEAIYDSMYWTKNWKVDLKDLNLNFTTLFLSILGILLSILITYLNSEKARFIPIILATFPFFEIGAAFGCVPNYLAFALLLSGWTATFATFVSSVVKKKKGAKEKRRKINKAAGIGAVVAIITLLAFLGVNTLLSFGGYTRDNGTKDLRIAIKEGVANIYDLITGEDRDASMKDGMLYKYKDRDVKNRRYMTVTASGILDNLYIKGYVGAKYTGSTFEEFDNYNNYKKMYDAFEEYNLYPQAMLGKALQSIVDEGKGGSSLSTKKNVPTNNLRRKKPYAYTLDNTLFPESFKYNYDLTAKPPSRGSYSYTSFMDPTNYIKITSSELYFTKEYQYLRGLYNDYVEKEYLQIPDNNAYLKSLVKEISQTAGDDYAIADYIRYYLKEHTKITDKTGELPASRDFVNYFLNENKKGYSPHYAAAATLMLRAAGVPARYVEGFILTPDKLKDIKENDDGNYVIDVTDNESHAWVEIYSNNFGWISIEVTPGFYTGHLGSSEEGEEEQGSADAEYFHIDQNSDLQLAIPPAKKPENKVEDEKTTWQKVVDFFSKYGVKILKIILLVLLYIVVFIIGASVLLLIRWLILRRIRKQKFAKLSGIFDLYLYFNKILNFEKIKNTEKTAYLRYARYAAKQSVALLEEDSVLLMNIFLKAGFSNKGINSSDLAKANELVNKYKTTLISRLSLKDKILFILVFALA